MVMDRFDDGAKPEEISLFMDGELEVERVERVCVGLRQPHCLETWVCYHVIGDALRGWRGATTGFSNPEHFAGQLAAEPTVLAPRRRPAPAAIALAAAATVAAVSLVSWVALTTMPGDARVAAAIAAAKQASAVRAADARPAVDNEYVLVHQEYSPTTAIQGVRPYLRAVAAGEPDARP